MLWFEYLERIGIAAVLFLTFVAAVVSVAAIWPTGLDRKARAEHRDRYNRFMRFLEQVREARR